jgi:hypothetical protein
MFRICSEFSAMFSNVQTLFRIFRLPKSLNSSLRTQIPDSKFKEMKEKFKRPENCQNLMISLVNEEVLG